MINCKTCYAPCIKKGFNKNKKQRIYCNSCKKHQLINYTNGACLPTISKSIKILVKEGCGIRSISRILKIAASTVISRIKKIAAEITKPILSLYKTYEVDELRTYIKIKSNLYWVVCAYQTENKSIVDFSIGRRTKATLQKITDTLILTQSNKIYTDKFPLYSLLIPKQQHSTKAHMTNHVERFNLNLRTHLKRLNRKTICFSKSIVMLSACLKIYLWS